MPPEEVLSQAAKATQTLQSAQYLLQADFDATSASSTTKGTAHIDGILGDAGLELRFTLDLTANQEVRGQAMSISGNVEVVVLPGDEVFLNIHSLTSQPSSTLFKPELIARLADRWWKLPAGDTPVVIGTVTPDPRLLQAQAQVVKVTKDRGMESVNGRSSYHYDVTLDKEKLLAFLEQQAEQKGEEFDVSAAKIQLSEIDASGQIWIDEQTYYLQKLQWMIAAIPMQNGGTASASFTVTFRNLNSAPNITPPEDATIFSPAVLFTMPSEQLAPDALPGMDVTQPSMNSDSQMLNELMFDFTSQ